MYSQTNHIGGSNLPRESTPIQEAHVARETFGSIDRWRGDCPLHLQSVHLWCDEEDKMLMEKKNVLRLPWSTHKKPVFFDGHPNLCINTHRAFRPSLK